MSTSHLPDVNIDQHGISLNPGSITPQYGPSTPQMHHASPSTNSSTDKTRRQWDYYNRLLRILIDQGLLDRQTIVEWIVDTFIDRIKHNDDINLRYLIPIIFQFSNEILEYEIFSRKISYYCCKRLGQYHTDIFQPINFNNLISCPQHRVIVYSLSAIVQCITLRCSSALLYNNPIDDQHKSDTLLLNYGSPLDFLPCSPSQLPLPIGIDHQLIKQMLIQSEDEIRSRSLAIEHKWSTEKLQQSISGQTISRVLSVLEILDEFKEEKYLLDNVYNKIYPNTYKIEPLVADIEIEVIHLMCDWAITTRRHGVYRTFFIARLLERRQNELKTIRLQEINETIDDKESNTSSNIQQNPFQIALTEYVLKKAPYIDETSTNDLDLTTSFTSLVMLFSEFIRLHLFSPMQFMCNLVAHGLTPLINDNHENNNSHIISNHNVYKPHVYSTMIKHEAFNMDSNFDRRQTNPLIDLDPVETMNSSPSTTPKHPLRQTSKIEFNRNSHQTNEDFNNQQRNRKRCLFYLDQFPYPLEDDFRDDFNQRKIVLFGITPKR
jgi:mediator of RNA polymerase II transcription subunit 12